MGFVTGFSKDWFMWTFFSALEQLHLVVIIHHSYTGHIMIYHVVSLLTHAAHVCHVL